MYNIVTNSRYTFIETTTLDLMEHNFLIIVIWSWNLELS